jgi:hypothetical protein
VTAFSIQEIIIASLYIDGTRKCLQPSEQFQKMKFRLVMRHLIYASVFVIMMDIAVLCVQYANLFQIQVVFKGAVYSVKLFVEFFILNRLKNAVGTGISSSAPRIGGYASSRKSATTSGRGGIAGHVGVALNTFDADGDREVLVSSQINMETDKTGGAIVADRNVPLTPDMDGIHVTRTLECRSSCP